MISALVSAYFAEEYLHSRLINLFGQKGIDLEIIVVAQKGSQEETIASQYNTVVVPTLDIPPIGEAWNLAIERAKGDYLVTANCDDRFHLDGLKTLQDAFTDDIGLVFSRVDIQTDNEIYVWKRLDHRTGEVHNIKDILEKRCIVGPMPMWRKSIHIDIGYFDETYTVAADYDMWLRMARAGVRFSYLDESCGVYMNRHDSLEHRNQQLLPDENRKVRA